MKKLLAVAIMILFISVSVIPSTGTTDVKQITIPTSSGNTLYVGGNGTGNYSTIQDAIDDASEGDTVFVFDDSSPYYEHAKINKMINLIGEDKNTTIIDGSGSGDVARISADWVNISGFTIQNSGSGWDGIRLDDSDNNIISDNDILNNGDGIILYNSNGNIILDNNISNDIVLWDSSSNNISLNNGSGICLLYGSSSNNIWGNSFINKGLSVYYSYQNTVANNTVNGKPLVYLEDESGIVIDDAGQIILINCDNINIQNQELSNTRVGIELLDTNNCFISRNIISLNNGAGISFYGSSSNIITGNNISSNKMRGIWLWDSHSNKILDNTITSNEYDGIGAFISCNNVISGNIISSNYWFGIFLYHCYNNSLNSNSTLGIWFHDCSDNNLIYHNNFINNTQNAFDVCSNNWDNGYPSGGNYWDDYNGTDVDGDGIGDTPYEIPPFGGEDGYPLMSPYVDEEPPNVEITKPEKALYFFNFKVRPYLFRKPLIFGNIDIEVDASDDNSGVNWVEFYIDDENKYTDTTEPYSWTWDEKTFFRCTIKVTAYDNAGNNATKEMTVWKFF